MHHWGTAVFAAPAGVLVATVTASASPVDDAWPYGGFFELSGVGTSNGDNVIDYSVEYLNGNVPDSYHYSTTFDAVQIPFVGYTSYQKVFDSPGPADTMAYVPPDGMTAVTLSYAVVSNTLIVDPHAGVGDQFALFPPLNGYGPQNTFISDSAGTQDVFSFAGRDLTLVEFPAAVPDWL